MTMVRNSLIGLCVAAASLGTFAQSSNEHKDHHPAGSLPSATNTSKAPVKPTNVDKMASMEKQMKAMQAMHEKMASAKTSDERQALMAEHMKMMHDIMGKMQAMKPKAGMTMQEHEEWINQHQKLMEDMMGQMMGDHHMMMDMGCMSTASSDKHKH